MCDATLVLFVISASLFCSHWVDYLLLSFCSVYVQFMSLSSPSILFTYSSWVSPLLLLISLTVRDLCLILYTLNSWYPVLQFISLTVHDLRLTFYSSHVEFMIYGSPFHSSNSSWSLSSLLFSSQSHVLLLPISCTWALSLLLFISRIVHSVCFSCSFHLWFTHIEFYGIWRYSPQHSKSIGTLEGSVVPLSTFSSPGPSGARYPFLRWVEVGQNWTTVFVVRNYSGSYSTTLCTVR